MKSPFGKACQQAFDLNQNDLDRLLLELTIYANGIAHFLFHNKEALSLEQISQMISDVCVGLVNNAHIRENDFNLELARKMTSLEILKKLPERN